MNMQGYIIKWEHDLDGDVHVHTESIIIDPASLNDYVGRKIDRFLPGENLISVDEYDWLADFRLAEARSDGYEQAIAEARRRGAVDSAGNGSFPDLSGEWGGALTGPELVTAVLAHVGVPTDSIEASVWCDDICTAYEEAYVGNPEG